MIASPSLDYGFIWASATGLPNLWRTDMGLGEEAVSTHVEQTKICLGAVGALQLLAPRRCSNAAEAYKEDGQPSCRKPERSATRPFARLAPV